MTDLEEMRSVLNRAGIKYEEVRYEPAHGTSRPLGGTGLLPEESQNGPGGYYVEMVFTPEGQLQDVRVGY